MKAIRQLDQALGMMEKHRELPEECQGDSLAVAW